MNADNHQNRLAYIDARIAELTAERDQLIAQPAPLTRDELLAALREWGGPHGDPETAHSEADELLLRYIDDDEIRAAFEAVPRWYA